MNPLVDEWIAKAEGDLATAERELRARKAPNYDAACFHTQQMAEKYLKAYLQSNNQSPPRSHDLIDLLIRCRVYSSAFALIEPDLKSLNAFSTGFRYPGQSAVRQDARNAVRSAKFIRIHLRTALGLES